MVAAARGFVRIKVRVPEGYLIVGPYKTTRPALLVIDADGRRVDSIALLGADAAGVAKRFRAARKAPALERWELVTKAGRKVLDVKPGFVPPKGAKVLHPIPVRSAKPVPGAWRTDGDRHFVPRLLLGFMEGTDLERREYSLPSVSRGPPGARVAMAPLKVKGVLSVFPDIWHGTQVVVARKGGVDWKQVRASFVAAGCDAREK